jgi:hypothetical protein
MTITKIPQKKTADAFISGAPDGAKTVPEAVGTGRAMRGNQAQITLTLPPDLLAKANAAAEQLSISRAAFFKLAITRAVQAEHIDG